MLLGESGTLDHDLLCKDAYIVVRFRVLPRGRHTLRARMFGPRPIALLQAPRSPATRRPRGAKSLLPKRGGWKAGTVAAHDDPPVVSNTRLSDNPRGLAKPTLRPWLSAASLSQEDVGQLGVQRQCFFGRALPDEGKAEGATSAAMRWIEDAKGVQTLPSFKVEAVTIPYVIEVVIVCNRRADYPFLQGACGGCNRCKAGRNRSLVREALAVCK